MTDRTRLSDETWALRAREVLDRQYVVVVVLLILVGTTGLWASYVAYVDPGTETEAQTVSEWSRGAVFDHGATVTEENPVYDTGRQLRNQQAYFPFVSPELSGTYRFEYAASNGSTADIDTSLQLITRGERDGTVFWEESREIGSGGVTDIDPGTPIETEFEFDMNRTRAQLERVDETFGETPGSPVVIVRARTRMTGEVNGRAVNREFVDELRLTATGDSFAVNDPGEVTNTSRQTRTVQVSRERSPVLQVAGPVLLLSGFGGAVGLVAARRDRRVRLSQAERDRLTRRTYDEWISAGTLPETFDADSSDVVRLASLGDLVDAAADTGERVIYDPDRRRYAVFDDDRTYVCEPPLDPGDGPEDSK